jgi:hypothetical protein
MLAMGWCVVAAVLLAGCRSGETAATKEATPDAATESVEPVDRHDFEARLIEHEKITDDQARCVSSYVYSGYYDPASIRIIYDKGFTSLPSGLWGEYAHAMVACVLHDELIPGSGPPPGAS